MLSAAVRRGVAGWREPRRAARLARVLWIAWAVVVWNVIFDHAIVVAGRSYIAAALDGRFANMDDWMRPAVTRGFWVATAAASLVFLTGLAAARSAGRREPQGTPSPSRGEAFARRDRDETR